MIRKKNTSFLSNASTSKSIKEPMMSKDEQKKLKPVKKKTGNSLYNTVNVAAFTPEDNFLHFKNIKNHKIPVYITGHEKAETEVRCDYCGKIHLYKESIFIPDQIYDEKKNGETIRVFQGSGNFDCFECGLRYILGDLPYASRTTPYVYTNSKLYFMNMFHHAYPNETLYPAPEFKQMGLKWCGRYTFVKLHGCEMRRSISYYQMRSSEEIGNDINGEKGFQENENENQE